MGVLKAHAICPYCIIDISFLIFSRTVHDMCETHLVISPFFMHI